MRHLARRLLGSLSRREPAAADTAWAESTLTSGELLLWRRLSAPDRRHAIVVGRRFMSLVGTAPWTRDEIAGALLHDIGKLDSDLGTAMRTVATIVGPRTTRFRRYHDHERIGAEMLVTAGSSPVTVELVAGHGRAAPALARADNI
ncbi:MAG: HD domain-containing protein [Ilumatobacteraceae bacterium]